MIPAAARAPLAVGAVALLATVYVGLVDPDVPGHYPLCPTKAVTGLDCPFCGGLRAVHSLVRGDLVGALDHNLLVVVVLLPVTVLLWAVWLRRAWTSDGAGPGDAPHPLDAVAAALQTRPVLWGALALVLLFTVVRNVGGVPALAWLGSSAPA